MNDIENLLVKINALAQKQRTIGLTDSEKNDQAFLRRTYLDYIKGQVKAQLDSIRIVHPEDAINREH